MDGQQASAQRGRRAADGAIFIGTLLVAWMPIILNVLHHA
jgi:hypothetical protein